MRDTPITREAGPKAGPSRTITQQPARTPIAPAIVSDLAELHERLAVAANLDPGDLGYLVVSQSVTAGRLSRRAYLSLHGAAGAVSRARARGASNVSIRVVELRDLPRVGR